MHRNPAGFRAFQKLWLPPKNRAMDQAKPLLFPMTGKYSAEQELPLYQYDIAKSVSKSVNG
jgi:hypothetical protein